MAVTNILRDTREQKPYDFGGYPVTCCDETLDTGDYTLEPFCHYDGARDTYEPRRAIERKTGNDLLGSITHRRDSFKAEIKRAADWPEPLHIVVEVPRNVIEQNEGFMGYRDVTPSQVLGTVDAWDKHYNAEFHFFDGRAEAEKWTHDRLLDWLREAEPQGATT